jgi:hypothetical protein
VKERILDYKPGFRPQGYSSFDDVVKHISTGPHPLQITFEASRVKIAQPNLDKKTNNRKERETRENKPLMHDDEKREEMHNRNRQSMSTIMTTTRR